LPQLKGVGKDAFYDALKTQPIHWRNFIYRLVRRTIKLVGEVPHKDKLLIADDTANHKRGKKIELVSYIRDHTPNRTVLGMKRLVLSCFDAIIAHQGSGIYSLYRNLLHPASEGMLQCLQNSVRTNG